MNARIMAGTLLAAAASLFLAVSGVASAAPPHGLGGPVRLERRGGVTVVGQRAIPRLGVVRFRTFGRYPVFASRTYKIRRVNESLLRSVLDYEAWFKPDARNSVKYAPADLGSGVFVFLRANEHVATSPRVASVLLPTLECGPGVHECTNWFSVTLTVPSGTRVNLWQLFRAPRASLRWLARSARAEALSSDGCVRTSIRREPSIGAGFRPTWKNYAHFALTRKGLTLGFAQDQVGYPECGIARVTVPIRILSRHLSSLGRRLFAGLRSPVIP